MRIATPVDIIRDFQITLDPEEVWRCMGPAGAARDQLGEEVVVRAREAAAVSAARGGAWSFQLESIYRREVYLRNGPTLQGKFLRHLFQGSEGAIFVIATAGPGPERRVAELFARDRFVEALVLDAAASAVAMNAFTQMAHEIAVEIGSEARLGPCIRPGTDVWGIEGQKAIFDALPVREIGVTLLPSLLMSPQKSQSGIIPYGADLHIVADPDSAPCRTCSAVRCPMRLEEYAGSLVDV